MNAREAVNAVYQGDLVDCTQEDYHKTVRHALQDFAGKSIDRGDAVRAQIAYMEVKRLDGIHGPGF